MIIGRFIKHYFVTLYDLSKGWDKELNLIRPFITLFFAYASQIAVFPIINTVKDRTKKKVDKIFYLSSIIDGSIYIIIGIGYYVYESIINKT